VILVVGATGQLGCAVLHRALGAGRRVRALVRSGSRLPDGLAGRVEIAPGDLRDRASLWEACRDVDAVVATATVVFPRGPYSFELDEEQGYRSLVDVCEQRGVRQFVFTSILALPEPFASRVPTLRCKRHVEQLLARSRLPYTILRAGPFMDDYFALMGSALPLRTAEHATLRRPFWMSRAYLALAGGLIERRGLALAPRPAERRHSFVALADVAELILRVLGDRAALNATLDVGGPQALTWREVASCYARVLGRDVRLRAVASPALLRAAAALVRPFSPAAANQLGILWALASNSTALDMRPLCQRFGLRLTSAEQFLRAQLAASSAPARAPQPAATLTPVE
jgi:uncharacterized protein YbjT (DUF2867 family)